MISSAQIDLSWTASIDKIEVAGYRVYRCKGAGCTATKQVGMSVVPSYQDTGLSPSTSYTYRVSAYDEAGNVSLKSTAVTKKTQPLASTKFVMGDHVATIEKANVRSEPASSGTFLGTQPKGALGTVVGGPWYWNAYWWWQVDFDNGADGWVVQGRLKKNIP